jgi:hypothetical protein
MVIQVLENYVSSNFGRYLPMLSYSNGKFKTVAPDLIAGEAAQ